VPSFGELLKVLLLVRPERRRAIVLPIEPIF
jgi:hypothetical protein